MSRPGLLHRWGASHLLAAWVAYWVLLALAVLGRPAVQLWRLTHDPARHGSATFNFGNAGLSATIIENGVTLWAASAHLVTILLWLAVPPLALYGLWLRSRPARGADDAPRPAELRGGIAVDAAGNLAPRERERRS